MPATSTTCHLRSVTAASVFIENVLIGSIPKTLETRQGLIFGRPFGVKLFHHDMIAAGGECDTSDGWGPRGQESVGGVLHAARAGGGGAEPPAAAAGRRDRPRVWGWRLAARGSAALAGRGPVGGRHRCGGGGGGRDAAGRSGARPGGRGRRGAWRVRLRRGQSAVG